MEIITLPIESLTMHKGNAKLHPQEQIDQIKESIKLYGFNDPIGIWGKKNTIVEGHGRYMAAQEMGIDEVPCIRLDHLSDKQRREYMLVHNQTTMNSGWDFDLSTDELDGLDFDGFDFEFEDIERDVGYGEDFTLPEGDRETGCVMTFSLSQEQKETIESAVADMKESDEYRQYKGDNENSNGNALYLLVLRGWNR